MLYSSTVVKNFLQIFACLVGSKQRSSSSSSIHRWRRRRKSRKKPPFLLRSSPSYTRTLASSYTGNAENSWGGGGTPLLFFSLPLFLKGQSWLIAAFLLHQCCLSNVLYYVHVYLTTTDRGFTTTNDSPTIKYWWFCCFFSFAYCSEKTF